MYLRMGQMGEVTDFSEPLRHNDEDNYTVKDRVSFWVDGWGTCASLNSSRS